MDLDVVRLLLAISLSEDEIIRCFAATEEITLTFLRRSSHEPDSKGRERLFNTSPLVGASGPSTVELPSFRARP